MSESLGKMAKGGVIVFAGMLLFTFFEFITRIIIARYTNQNDYGIFSIGLVLLNFFVLISCLGLHTGTMRFIAFYRGSGEYGKVKGVIMSALQLSFIASLVCFLFFFFFSDFLAKFFHLPQPSVLKIFAIAVPFAVSTEILASVFRGFDRMQERFYFRDLIPSVLKLVFIIPIIILGYSFLDLVYAYIIAIVIVSVAFVIYTIKKLPISIKGGEPMGKELLRFSLPLLTANTSTIIIMQIDTMMLGYFKSEEVVGLYNAAHPIAQLIRFFMNALFFIYVPITSQLYAKNHMDEIRKNYKVLSKWTTIATLPFFLIIFLFPEAVLKVFFGSGYAQASVAITLQILALGMFIHIFFGPNAATLIVMGKSRLHLANNLIAMVMTVVLNFLLIPPYGIIGAAVATAISIGSMSILASIPILRSHQIHPFSKNFLKPMIVYTIIIFVIYTLVNYFNPIITVWTLIALTIFFFIIYGIIMILMKSFDEDDKTVLLGLGKVTGLEKSMLKIKPLLERFK